jgi:predicted Zn-dependent protease
MFAFVKGLFSRKGWQAPPTRKPRAPSRKPPRHLVLQQLEDRSVPSASAYTDTYSYGTDTSQASGNGTSVDYATSGYSWSGTLQSDGYYHITYSYYNVLNGQLNGLSASTVKEVIQEALGLWAKYVPIKFTEVADSGVDNTTGQSYNASGSADIRISSLFIDGPNGTLAYTYYPYSTTDGLAGDVFFDNSDKWATNPSNGIDLLEVATHELGHALGLAHSQNSSAIMYAYYGGRFSGLGTGYLTQDDISGIQSIYGSGTGSVTPLNNGGNGGSGGSGGSGGTGGSTFFTVSGSTLIVNGTSGDDTITYTAGTSSQTVTIDGQSYTIDPTKITKVVIVGGGGNDTLTVTGSSGNDTLDLAPNYGALTGSGYYVYWSGITTVWASGGGGNDTAYFFDSAGNNVFVSAPSYSYMSGNGYLNATYGFKTNVAYDVSGTNDTAYFIDGSGSNAFVSSSTYSVMAGSGYANYTVGFKSNIAYDVYGTNDTAYFVDGSGSNTFVATPSYSYMSGSNYFNMSVGFGTNVAYAVNGSNDTAYLFGSNGNDTFTGSGSTAVLSGTGYQQVAYGFSTVYAYGEGGVNSASTNNLSYNLYLDSTWS